MENFKSLSSMNRKKPSLEETQAKLKDQLVLKQLKLLDCFWNSRKPSSFW